MSNNSRKPSVALAMSLLLPGYGQLYNGEANKAIWLFLTFALLYAPVVALIALYLPSALMTPVLMLCLVATLGLWIYGMIDAWRTARRRREYTLAPWQTSGLYALVFILCSGVVLPLTMGYIRAHQVESFRIPSASMKPGILRGDYIFADKRYNCPNCKESVHRGDVAIFTYPNNRTLYYIKRIIGLPGDRIQIKGDNVSINSVSLTREHSSANGVILVTEGEGDSQWQVVWEKKAEGNMEFSVPPGNVFVLGDNRDNATDSRSFGMVPLQDVVGRARQIWFSYAGDGKVRWDRFGRVVQ